MQLWFSRGSEVSIREQLATQIILGIVGGELVPGQRLPSTRELARRFRLHPNTVSAAYRLLQRGKWVEFRKGSGIYVSAQKPLVPSNGIALDQLIADFFRSARKMRAPLALVRSRLLHWLNLQPPDHFLLVEPDPQLARIVVSEMQQAVTFPVHVCQPAQFQSCGSVDSAIAVAISFSAGSVQEYLPESFELLTLQFDSAGKSLARHLPSGRTALVGIASGWTPFLKNARTMLMAAGFDRDCLVLRDTTKAGWQRGLKETAAVVCDSLTAQELNGMPRVFSFPLLAERSLKELREYEQFVRAPLS